MRVKDTAGAAHCLCGGLPVQDKEPVVLRPCICGVQRSKTLKRNSVGIVFTGYEALAAEMYNESIFASEDVVPHLSSEKFAPCRKPF